MFPVHWIRSATTVDEIAAEVYDLTRRGTPDETRLAGAVAALRELNPTLPEDASPVDPRKTPYVRLRRIPRTPWRLPDDDGKLREELEAMGIRNVGALVQLSSSFLARSLPGYDPEALARYRNLARLMRIRGVDRFTAAFFHDHQKTPLKTPRDVAQADPATVRDLVVDSGYPEALLVEQPWRWISGHARMLVKVRRPRRSQLRPILVGRRELAREAAFWGEREDDPAVDERAAASAARIRWLRELQGELIRGNASLAERDAAAAFRHLRKVWLLAGRQAVADGILKENSSQASGPSVATVIELSRRILADLQQDDARLAVERLEIEPAGEGISGFAVGQLDDEARKRCDETFRSMPIGRLGKTASIAASRSLRDPDDVASLPASALAECDPAKWNDVLEGIELGWLDQPGPVEGRAAELLSDDALERINGSFELDGTAIGDRIVRHTPTFAPELGTLAIPLNGSFAKRYRRDVLAKLLDHTGGAGWDFAPIDFADPVRFAFILPQLFARHLPLSLARSLDHLGRRRIAQALRAGAVIRMADLSKPETASAKAGSASLIAVDRVDLAIEDSVSYGTTVSSVGDVNCSDLDALYEQFRSDNERGDAHYQAGDYENAAAAYVDVLEIAGGCQNLTDIVNALPSAHEGLIAEAKDWLVGQSSWTTGLLDATIDDAASYGAVISGVWREPPAETRGVIANALERDDIMFFTDPVDPRGGGGGSIPTFESSDVTTSDGGFDFDETDDEDDVIIFEFEPPPMGFPGPGGGGGGGGGGTDCPPGEPVTYVYDYDDLEREVLHAFSYLSQLLAGLNWLGFDPETVPVWSFDHLLSQARYYGEKADELQQRALSLLGSAEVRERDEFQAAASAAVAAQGVAVAKSQEAMARANLEATETARDAAAEAEKHTNDDVFWAIGVGLAAVAAVVLAAPTGGASVAVAVAAGASLAAAQASGAAAQASGRREAAAGVVQAGASTAVQIDGAIEGQQQASSQLEVAEAQVEVAAEQVALAVEQTALAELESAVAQGYLDLLGSQTLTANAYYELLDVISFLASRYLHMANRLAWLAERAYQHESRRYSSYVQVSYDQPDELVGRFTSAATLLSHVDALAHEHLTAATERNQLLATTYSLLINNPTSLVALQLTGATQFRISQKELDQRFPGLYLHSLDRIEVEFDGLLPAGGVRAVLRTANQTSVRVPHEAGLYFTDGSELQSDWCYPASEFPIGSATSPPRFAIKTVAGSGFTQVLSEYRRSRDGVILSVPAGALDNFEHLGTDAIWTLEIPRSGNELDLAAISDVRVVLYFSALYSSELADRQVEVLREETVGRNATFAATISAADDFTRLVSPPSDDRLRDLRLLRLDVADQDLPSNVTDREFRNVSVFVYGTDGRALALRLVPSAGPLGAAVSTSLGMADVPDGLAYSAVGDNASEYPDAPAAYRHREGDFPALDDLARELQAADADIAGRWVVKVLPEDNPDWLRRDDDGELVAIRSGSLDLATGGWVRLPGEFLHAAVTARVGLGEGTLSVALREDVLATIEIAGTEANIRLRYGGLMTIATAQVSRLDSLCELELAVHDNDARVSLDGVTLAALRIDDAVAAAAVPGPAEIGFEGSGSAELADVRITRLRHDGEPLQELVRETFASVDAVELSPSGAAWVEREHNQLDLASVNDVLVQLDYDGRIDYLDTETS